MVGGRKEVLYGIHSVLETLKSRRRQVEQITVAVGRQDRRGREILALASRQNVGGQRVPRMALDRLAGGQPHPGVVGLVAGGGTVSAAEVLASLGGRAVLLGLVG